MRSRSKSATSSSMARSPVAAGVSVLLQARFELEIRQAGGLDFARGFQNQRAFDDVAQFAHVAGPAVRQQFLPRAPGETFHALVHRRVKHFEKMFGQQQDVLVPLAQRRQAELHHVEAVKQILAKLIGGDGLDDVAIGGGDEAGR